MNDREMTPLHCAIWKDHYHMVELLIKSGANIMATDNSQRTLLHWAVLGSGEIDETSMAQLRNLISQVKMK